MDGNGRWAKQLGKPRLSGHSAGVKSLKRCVELCVQYNIRYLTAFAFSSENWRRPVDEVQGIMKLLISAIRTEAKTLFENEVELRFIGNREALSAKIQAAMKEVEERRVAAPKMTLIIALNYGGRWDILQAAQKIADHHLEWTEENLERFLTTAPDIPDPDLIIRTGGEMRISNFLLWQAAYAELYFSSKLWPDFDQSDLLLAITEYTKRERRFGAL